jgi:putative ABC transport system permease protein
MATFEVAHAGYFTTLGIPIVEGRAFDPSDRGNAAKVAIVSESLARKLWPGRSPLGERFHFGGQTPWLTVVGVAADARYRELEKLWDSVYWPPGQNSLSAAPGPGWYTPSELIVRTSLGVESLAGPLRRVVREQDPEIPVERVASVETLLARELARPRFRASLIASFALVAIVLTAAGLYGVLAAVARQRTAEIGIRLALGATRRQALAPLLMRGAQIIGGGLAFGAGAALSAHRSVESLLFGVPSLDALSFAMATVLLGLAACAAAVAPIRYAARTDCAASLRHE